MSIFSVASLTAAAVSAAGRFAASLILYDTADNEHNGRAQRCQHQNSSHDARPPFTVTSSTLSYFYFAFATFTSALFVMLSLPDRAKK